MSSSAKEILIIGGGVIGLCSAYYCLKRGHRVTVLERGDENRDCCSLGNAGMVVPSHFVPLAAPGMIAMGLKWMFDAESPFYIRPRLSSDLASWLWKFYRAATPQRVKAAAPVLRDMSLRSRSLFEELDNEGQLDFGLNKKGLMMLCKTQQMLDEEAEMAEQGAGLGIETRVLDAKELATLDPRIRMDVAGAVYFPQDCHLSPNRFLAGLRNEVEKAGGKIVWNSEVVRLETRADKVRAVHTETDSFVADDFVIATGVWTSGIVRDLKWKLPMQAGKGYSVTVEKPPVLPDICSILCEARIAVTPMNGALRFGGTMEIAGLDQSINRRRLAGIFKNIPEYFPEFREFDFEGLPAWSGLRPCSPDGLPYLGRCRTHTNLCIAAGHGMLGLSLGPVTGEAVAAIVSETDPAFDARLLSPNRYM